MENNVKGLYDELNQVKHSRDGDQHNRDPDRHLLEIGHQKSNPRFPK